MREHLPKIVIVGLLLLIVGVPFLLRPRAEAAAETAERLIIYTPHNEQIRTEMARGFNDYRRSQGLPPVAFDWRASGGTSDLRRQLLAQYTAAAQRGREDAGIGADLFFGGGEFEHSQLVTGVTVELGSAEARQGVPTLPLDTAIGPRESLVATFQLRQIPAEPFRGEASLQLFGEDVRLTLDDGHPNRIEHRADGGQLALTATVRRDATDPTRATVELMVRNGLPSSIGVGPLTLVVPFEPGEASASALRRLPISIPAQLPDGLLEAAFPSPMIGGEPLYHRELHWVGVVLSSFGIVYNRDVLAMLDVPHPQTWADLADPRLIGWVGLADPGHSGSIAVTYDTILRREGWTEGWAMLRRVFANARYFTSSASKVPVDVSAGEAAIGMSIDFFGRFQAGAIAAGGGTAADRVGYVDPQGMTAVTADPISVLRGAPSEALAHAFVAWLMTPESQRLWQARVGAPGGPQRFELRRQPIRRDLYTPEEMATWADPEIDPFGQARPFEPGMPSYYAMVAPVCHAIAIDIHADLVAAWRAIQRTPEDHPNRDRMLAAFDAMPPELTLVWPDQELQLHWREAIENEQHHRHSEAVATIRGFRADMLERYRDRDTLLADRVAWTQFFRSQYREVVRLAR
jgi:iron(III) transport system substrate-binding protein